MVVRDGVIERAAVPVMHSTGWVWLGRFAEESRAVVVAVSEDDGLIRVAHPRARVVTVDVPALRSLLAKGFAHARESGAL